MKSVTFYDPEGTLDVETVNDMLSLVGYRLRRTNGATLAWTANELLVAYDWAAREHLNASDNPVRRRPRPAGIVEALPAATSGTSALFGGGRS